ncbi:ankyrin repeat domain-containing protein, chloroplastic-like isoform X2 [Populus nigra]|uniref:ankyrin repeat domain-containing protein, chloroplastic-like isoform X2 n=1 Tax=Populus nigra TaxID=3691 RepID=UPI002B2707A1|nr:ankyrin repeat domain-containing protein, chloroplastic-like isoform X2 [Populus nigra]
MSLPTLLNPQTPKLHVPLSLKFPSFKTLKIPTKIHSFSPSLQSQFPIRNDSFEDQDHAIGDCIVFEEGIFEDPYLENNSNAIEDSKLRSVQKKIKRVVPKIEEENLVPENWREVQAEINIGKKERRKIAQELEYNKKFERKRKGLVPIRNVNLEEYQAFREAKLAQLKPLVLDYPQSIKEEEEEEEDEVREIVSERVKGKNPRWAVYGRGLDDVREFFNGEGYEPGEQKSEGKRKLFTKEEKVLLNKRVPDLAVATSIKWLPVHTLAASGEFYLMDALLKHNVDINAVDVNGWTALHRAIICKKQAIISYLLRESADPFVHDAEGATLMHYAVQTASAPAIKVLLLYNVDINLQDNDGLTALDLCLYSGRDTRTCELIKLFKQFAKKSTLAKNPYNASAS